MASWQYNINIYLKIKYLNIIIIVVYDEFRQEHHFACIQLKFF